MCLVGNKRAEIARVVPCENNFCTKYAHHLHFCGLQKLNTLNLRHFHPPLNPCNHFSTVLIKTNWNTISCKYKGCYNLTSLYSYRPDPVAVDSNVFLGIDANKCTLYVPQGSFGNYYVTSGWDYFSKIVEFDPTGIDAVTTKSDAKEVSRYSVDGQKLDTPVKGLNIVKYNDGSIKKVVVE